MHTPTDPKSSSLVPLKPADVEGDSVPTIIGRSTRNPVAESLALSAGSTLGHFEIIAPLGAGGMASVLKARDNHLGRIVALKILPPETARDADAVTRFKQEARAAAKLDHENVSRVFYSGEDRGLHFIAFEFVEGETLRARIERLGKLSPAESVRFLLHCAAGLQHLSERGVVHRDIKPSNVVVTPDGRAKLIDLGLARHTESISVNGNVTQSGMTLGTFDYISPEQARDPRTADVRSDIYSLGCTFYHAMTGRPPVPEGTAAVKLSAQQLSPPTDPRELNPEVPDSLAMVLNRMLGKDPARRYQTPAELITDLTEVARQLGVTVDGSSNHSPVSSSSTNQPRLRGETHSFPVGWIVVGVLVLAVGLVFASLTGNRGPAVSQLPWDDPPATKLVSPFEAQAKGDPPSMPNPANTNRVARNAEELLAAANRSEVSQITLRPGVVYDLTDTAGLYFVGRKLSIECAETRTPAIIRVAVSPIADPPVARDGGFTVHRADSVSLRGIRFEFTEKPATAAEGDTLEPVGVAILETGKVDIQECSWDDSDGKVKAAHVSALWLSRSYKAKSTEFTAKNTYFNTRRWTGIDFDGPFTASLSECGFITGKIGVRLSSDFEASGSDASSTLDVKHSTFLLDHSATAIAADSVKAAVTVGFCVFAAPGPPDPTAMMTDPDRKPTALLIGHKETSAVTYATVPNEPSGYYRTDIPGSATGSDSIDLTSAPWKTVPPVTERTEPWKVLELNPAMRAVRVSRPSGVHILGATLLPTATTRIYAEWPPGSASALAPKPGVKVWYPNPQANEKALLPKGVFEDLQKALDALRSDEVLHIRANGVVKVPTVTLAKAQRVITILPEEGFNPILVPAVDGPLFRVEDGELRLERLHLRLTLTDESRGLSTAAVTLAGGKRCVMTDCTVTVEDSVGDSTSVVLMLPGLGDAMTKTVRPEARFEKCLIRGSGRLVRMPAAVPATIAVSNVTVALTGPVIDLGPPDVRPAEGAVVRLQLARVTALLSGPLVEMKLTDTTDPTSVAVQIESDASLYAPFAKASTPPLLNVTNGDSASLSRYFQWVPVTPSRFANFPVRSTFVAVPPKRLDSTDWLMFSKEEKSSLGKYTFVNAPTTLRGLTNVTAAELSPGVGETADEIGARSVQIPVPPESIEK